MAKEIKYTQFPECPNCHSRIEETEDLGDGGLITYHGSESGSVEYECQNCFAVLAIEEIVTRQYNTELVTEYYVVEVTNEDGTKYIYEEDKTYTTEEMIGYKKRNLERLVEQLKETSDRTDLWYNKIKSIETKKVRCHPEPIVEA